MVTDEHVTLCSSSDHSDIVTLGDSSKEERTIAEGDGDDDDDDEEVPEGREDLYMGTSSSSQYTFSAPETGKLLHVLLTSLAEYMHNGRNCNKDRIQENCLVTANIFASKITSPSTPMLASCSQTTEL